jgi:hypothetical protein
MKSYLFVVALLTAASGASGAAVLTVGSSVDFESVGNLVVVDVTLFGLTTTLDSYRFDVDFTPGALSAWAAVPGTVDAIDNVGGTIKGIARSNIGLNFGGTLFRLYFNAVGPGNISLSIPAASVSLLDSGGNEIPFTTVGGNVHVDGGAPLTTPEPRSLSLLLIGMAVIGARFLKQRRPLIRKVVKLKSGGLA